jgi:hypothetical protein
MQPKSPFLGKTPVFSLASSAEMRATELLLRSSGQQSSSSTTSAAIVSEIDTLLPPMFDLFDSKTSVIDDYDNNDEWLDACLGPLPPGAEVLGRSCLRSFGRNPLWG